MMTKNDCDHRLWHKYCRDISVLFRHGVMRNFRSLHHLHFPFFFFALVDVSWTTQMTLQLLRLSTTLHFAKDSFHMVLKIKPCLSYVCSITVFTHAFGIHKTAVTGARVYCCLVAETQVVREPYCRHSIQNPVRHIAQRWAETAPPQTFFTTTDNLNTQSSFSSICIRRSSNLSRMRLNSMMSTGFSASQNLSNSKNT